MSKEFFDRLNLIEQKVKLKNKIKADKPFRINNVKVKALRENQKCVVCNETRALEYAHIIPVSYLKRVGETHQQLVDINDNGLFLCKTHHWCFDHMLLTELELETIFINKKKFINTTLLDFANMVHKENPKSRVTAVDRKILQQFNSWLSWVSNVFFIKNI